MTLEIISIKCLAYVGKIELTRKLIEMQLVFHQPKTQGSMRRYVAINTSKINKNF